MRIDRKARNTVHSQRVVKCVALLGCLLIVAATGTHAQESRAHDALARTIAGLDTALFDAFNACDLNALGSLVADDLEFFHDHDGLSVGKQAFLDSTRKNICGKVRRDLVPSTLEIYRLGDYGALEIGVHRFHHPGRDDTEPIGEAKFVIIWQRTDSTWKMTRTISYAHGALPK
jgi:ketosteroid isomerase-like protein